MENLNMFEMIQETFKINKPIRLIELFAGVGSQAMALRNIGADFEHYRVVEFDKHAIASYNAIHKTGFPTMDITKIKGSDLGITDTDKYTYIMTYSFPCQDLSLAGKRKGMTKGEGTRSGLLWEVERLLTEVKELPQVLLMENVPEVVGQKNIQDFRKWQYFLEGLGYSNHAKTLNAKDYGVAQNRNRTFMVSILGDWYYKFPTKSKLNKTIKNYLEDDVNKKYYIVGERLEHLREQLILKTDSNAELITCDYRYDEGLRPRKENMSPTLTTKNPDNNGLSSGSIICIRQATKKGFIECKQGGVADLSYAASEARRGRVQSGGDLSPTLTTNPTVYKMETESMFRILTSLEYWRLMGFSDEDYKKAAEVVSNNQLYKQVGNSIVVDVLEGIFKELM